MAEDDAELIEWLSAATDDGIEAIRTRANAGDAEVQENLGGEPVNDSVKAQFAILRVAVTGKTEYSEKRQ